MSSLGSSQPVLFLIITAFPMSSGRANEKENKAGKKSPKHINESFLKGIWVANLVIVSETTMSSEISINPRRSGLLGY